MLSLSYGRANMSCFDETFDLPHAHYIFMVLPQGPFSTPNKGPPNKDEDKTIEIKPAEC